MSKIIVVAECGINWLGNLEIARNMITVAQNCGADAAKFQLYDVDKLFPDKAIMAQEKNWYEEVKKTQLSFEEVNWLAAYCQHIGIEFLASCFDLERLSWLEEIGVKRHKVGSRANKDKELIDAMIATGKEVLVSCQRSYLTETSFHADKSPIKYLYCVPEYPTPFNELEFDQIAFPPYSGFSDHTQGIEACIVAMSRGATIIEKHFTLDRSMPGPDMICSMEPSELRDLVQFARKVEEVL